MTVLGLSLVEAVCENIGAGDHSVKIRTTRCGSYNPGDYNTGWKSYSRMHIEEVRQSARLDAGKFQDNAFVSYYIFFLVSKYSPFLA